VRHLLTAQQATDDAERLDHAVDPHARRVVSHPELPIVAALPARPQAEIQASVAEPIERGRLARNDQGMTEVVGQHVRPDSQRRRHGGGRGKGGRRGQLASEVIGHVERCIPQLLRAAGEGGPVIGLVRRVRVDGESEWLHRSTVARELFGAPR